MFAGEKDNKIYKIHCNNYHLIIHNSVSALEQVKINGSNHEVMIRGKDKGNPVDSSTYYLFTI